MSKLDVDMRWVFLGLIVIGLLAWYGTWLYSHTKQIKQTSQNTGIEKIQTSPTAKVETPVVASPPAPSYLLSKTNEVREANDVPDLTETAVLDQAAMKKCEDMQTRNYWAHLINGEAFNQFDPPAYKTGENLARGYTEEQVTTAWMNSPEHRENLLDPVFKNVGFATCDGPINNLIVQELET